MALTVVKYRKTLAPEGQAAGTGAAILVKNKVPSPQQQQYQIIKKPVLRLQGSTGLVINKIPIKHNMKRGTSATIEPAFKSTKYSLQTIASAGTPLTSFQWQKTIGGNSSMNSSGTTITPGSLTLGRHQDHLGTVISSLPPNTIIQAKSNNNALPISNLGHATTYLHTNGATASLNAITQGSTVQVRRPTIYIKRELPKRTIRSVTLELIENNPYVHLGVSAARLPLLKSVICVTANVTLSDCYLTLKKLRQNEEFALLGEYFEMGEAEVQQVFVRTVSKLARYMRFLVRWPDSKKYYDRHKDLPFAFRSDLSHVQSMVECVETDMQHILNMDCNNYKFIFSITTNGIISYVSDAYFGHNDDLTIFNASNFKSIIPKYLSLFAVPGKAIRRKRKSTKSNGGGNTAGAGNEQRTASGDNGKNHGTETDSTTDSADESAEDAAAEADDNSPALSRYGMARIGGEVASHQTLNVVNSELTSRKVKDFTVPTIRVPEPACRLQIRHMIECLREFKILQPCAIQELLLYQYLNEIIVVAAALTNLQR